MESNLQDNSRPVMVALLTTLMVGLGLGYLTGYTKGSQPPPTLVWHCDNLTRTCTEEEAQCPRDKGDDTTSFVYSGWLLKSRVPK